MKRNALINNLFSPGCRHMTTWVSGLVMLAAALPLRAHEGDDHGAPATKSATPGGQWFTLNAVTDSFEVVLRYWPAEAGEEMHMKMFASDYETNAPVDRANMPITCLEDKSVIVEVHHVGPGTYELHATFPSEKPYTLSVGITTEAGSAHDVRLGPIEVGKELPATESEASGGIWFSPVLMLLAGLVAGALLMWLMGRRKRSAAMLLLVMLCIPGNLIPTVKAHEGHDHEEPKPEAGSAAGAEEVEVLKETQFLFSMRTAFARKTKMTTLMKLYGQVTPSTGGEARIIAPQDGAITALHVQVGDLLRKGQPLAVIEQNLTAIEQAQLQNERNNAIAEYESARRDYERLQQLADVVAAKELIEAKLRLDRATENKRLYENLGSRMFVLTAPISGTVDNYSLAIGQQVTQGQELFRLFDTRELKVVARTYESDLLKLRASAGGETALTFTVECIEEDEHFTEDARLIAFGKAIDPVSQSSEVVLALDNREGSFKPGQFVNVYVKTEGDAVHTVVPASAVTDINGKPFVFVHSLPEILEARPVSLGQGDADETAVMTGLAEGDRVIVRGTYQAKSIYLNQ